jgi:anion-transporting  ArsA/GET3 family ATPase
MKLKGAGKRDTVYFLYGGKGGVGKTSMAAAAALHFSNND